MPEFMKEWVNTWACRDDGNGVERSYETMTPQVAIYLLDMLDNKVPTSVWMCISYGDIRQHPVLALLALESPELQQRLLR
jgi:hypothetical protein